MIPNIRIQYNQDFTPEKYTAFLDSIAEKYHHRPPFRIAETPFFVPQILRERLQEACAEINKTICHPDFKKWSQEAIKDTGMQVPGEDYNTRFLQMDFGICLDERGVPFPQLIELQVSHPSIFFRICWPKNIGNSLPSPIISPLVFLA